MLTSYRVLASAYRLRALCLSDKKYAPAQQKIKRSPPICDANRFPHLTFAVLPLACSAYEGKGQQNKSLMNTTTIQKDYTAWQKEIPAEEIREEQECSDQREIGKQLVKAAIAAYDDTWNGHHGHEITSRLSTRKHLNELAYARVEIYA
jgi:hypothetical protein